MVTCGRGLGRGYLVEVFLGEQRLRASRDGVTQLESLVTTGKQGFRTPRGRFFISAKGKDEPAESPHGKGPGWYSPRVLKYALRLAGQLYIHTWSQRQDSDFGPGSQDGEHATLGCVAAPDWVMAKLYAWAPLGTEVRVRA